MPGSQTDTLIQSDLTVIYKVSLGRGLCAANRAKGHGVAVIDRNQPEQAEKGRNVEAVKGNKPVHVRKGRGERKTTL